MIYFPHIPKCGGTTVKELFYSVFGIDGCLKVWGKGFASDVEPDEFAAVEREFLYSKKAIVGHLSFKQLLRNEYAQELYMADKLKVITIVRDPIDRIISLFNYASAYSEHPNHDQIKEIQPLQYIMDEPANKQCKFLRLNEIETVDSISNRISIIPLNNSIEIVTSWIKTTTGMSARSIPRLNVTAESFPDFVPFKRSTLTAVQINLLKQKHREDYRLYETSQANYAHLNT